MPIVEVAPGGEPLAELVAGLVAAAAGRRVLLGIAGAPGAGKSRLAAALAALTGAVVVPMDGWHLADAELARQGLAGRKGAPETFDPWGYAALLRRLRQRPDHVVYAPGFERGLEQPLAGAVAVLPQTDVVVTEGSYLLLPDEAWAAARAPLDATWCVHTTEELRRERLVARHVASGKQPRAAQEWRDRVDEPNARLVHRSADRADLYLDLTRWCGGVP